MMCVARRVLRDAGGGYQLTDDEQFVIYTVADFSHSDVDDDENIANDDDADWSKSCTASLQCCDAAAAAAVIRDDWE